MECHSFKDSIKSIQSDLQLLGFQSSNVLFNETFVSDVTGLLLNNIEERANLLLEILAYLDSTLRTQFEKLDGEKIIPTLTDMYLDVGFITKDEKSFVTGEMDLQHQIKIWLQIVSCLKHCTPDSCESSVQFKNNVDYIHNLICNPLLKESINSKIKSNAKKTDTIDRASLIDHAGQQLLEVMRNISILEDVIRMMPSDVHDDIEVDSSSYSAKDVMMCLSKQYETEVIIKLTSDWVKTVKSILKSNTSVPTNEHLEEINKTLSGNIVSLHKLCMTFSEFMSAFKDIRRIATEIIQTGVTE